MTRLWNCLALSLIITSMAFADGPTTKHSIAQGPFEPTWRSLETNYKCPEWYRDAKFGIWAHWTAQCVPEMGDWYARKMYFQGDQDYEDHLARYGHPSVSGFMELDNQWKAEHWEPEKLIKLYKAAGAQFFVALANHHDNFDCYDSKYHDWNSVRIGPKKDIVGIWAKTAREAGLKFGVSNHSSHAWHWFQPAYGYDPEGPKAGIRYDAFTLKKEDGVGKWWEGLDPQDLYTGPTIVMPDGIKTTKEAREWHDKHDGQWFEDAPDNPKFVENWFLRCQDLLDKYHPDLLYFDDTQLPFKQTGLDIAAHYYNSNIEKNGGSLQCVMTAKKLTPEQRPAMVEDYERGAPDDLQPLPWQTCSCIGEWHYHKGIHYKSVGNVAQQFVDIVSKNGCLLLSIPVRGDGTIDDDEMKFLDGWTKWITIHGEGLFGSRPWKKFGEGPPHAGGGMFNESRQKYGAEDLRFTTKDGALYVYVLGVPSSDVVVKSLAGEKPIAGVKMLGSDETIKWELGDGGLKISKPASFASEDVIAFKVTFKS